MNVIDEIAAERKRQIEVEGWTLAHDDDEHKDKDLAHAAACYALSDLGERFIMKFWPWGKEAWKPKERRRNLIRAAALLVAEIERLDRQRR